MIARRFLLLIWGVAAAATLFSCSNSWFCKRCILGGRVTMDTAKVTTPVITPGERADSAFNKMNGQIDWDSLRNANPDMFPESPPCPELPPVMELNKGKVHGKIKQTDKGLDVQIACDPDTVEIEVKVPYVKEIEVGYAWWALIIAGLVGAGVVAVLMLLRR